MNAKPTNSDAEPTWPLLGLQVGRKTEIIALAAFMLSIGGVLFQVFNYTRGAVVSIFPPDQIVITSTDKLGRRYAEEMKRVAFIAAMAYVNDGDIGHNAVIRQERLLVSVGGRKIEHRWYEFGSSDIEGNNLVFKRESEARPFAINAGSAVSHETLFSPWEVDCAEADKGCDPRANYLHWDDFLKAIRATSELSFTTTAIRAIRELSITNATCLVRLRQWEIDILEKSEWLAPACTDMSAGGQIQRKGERARPHSLSSPPASAH
jgi:hypothetical protein